MSRPFIDNASLTVSSSGDMSQTSITSAALIKKLVSMAAFYVSWSGTSPVGTITVDGSLDGTNWGDIGMTGVSVSGNTGSTFIDLGPTSAPYLRVKYTKTSGTGTLTVRGSAMPT